MAEFVLIGAQGCGLHEELPVAGVQLLFQVEPVPDDMPSALQFNNLLCAQLKETKK